MTEKIKFIFLESFKTFKRYPLYSFISSLTIMVCLLLISLIIYLSNVTNNIFENFQSNESVLQIFINNDNEISETTCNRIKDENNFVKKINFKTRDDLIEEIEVEDFFESNLDFMPCLCSAVIDITKESEFQEIDDKLKSKYSDISKIVYPQSYLNKFEEFSSSLFAFIFGLGLIIFIVSIFNISNVIKLNLESRKNVIETLKLHGATKNFIRFPFIIEGIIQGLFGACLSIIVIYLMFNLYPLNDNNHFLVNSLITTISFKTYLFFNIIFGVLLGFISSNLGVSNYLD